MSDPTETMAPEIITLGCRLNAFESEVMRAHAESADIADLVILNTCAVTAEAERQARQAIRRVRRRRPNARVVVTGCAAQIDPARYAAMPEVDVVLGNADKLVPESLVRAATGEQVEIRDIATLRETAGHLIEGFDGRARAFVQIQQGCDHRCSFCIIPMGRGPSRSLAIGEIVAQCEKLVDNGYREIVLTGVDLTAYGNDLAGGQRLGGLVRRLLDAVPGIERLRLSSVDPAEMDETLFKLIAGEPRFAPHLHLSLQAGDDMILKRMKRRHSRDGALKLCATLRRARPDIALGADLIAGFPTETEKMFQNTLDFVGEAELVHLHVFPYSQRPGTPAARMPQVEAATRKARAAALRAAGGIAHAAFLAARVGATAKVLVEEDRRGRSEHFLPVSLDRAAPTGRIVAAHITGAADGALVGRIIKQIRE